MLKSFADIFRIPELKKRVLFTLAVIAVYRLGAAIPIPGVNAAALKQVPTCEYFPSQAVLTNCMGPVNIVRAIEENDYPVNTVITVSTDKACKPVNVMGMTKAIQEKIIIAANILNPKTRFICVRYGNGVRPTRLVAR